MFDDAQEPKDMFADVPEPSAKPPVAPAPAPGSNPVAPEAQGGTVSGASQPQVIDPGQPLPYEAPKSTLGVRMIAMVAVSLLAIGVAGYAAYRFMVKDAVPQQVSEVIGDGREDDEAAGGKLPDEEGKGSGETQAEPDEEEDGGGTIAVVDSDGDGLSNDEERIAGTSVAKPDTDEDGLGDREEVKFYSTDPKKADTDGDGHNDGVEVENGYNPNGEGKLLEIPKTE
jgi:hypothetical protein